MGPPSTGVVGAERKGEGSAVQVQNLSSNQIAAKVMQLRLRGKHKEADELQVRGQIILSFGHLLICNENNVLTKCRQLPKSCV